MIIKEGDDIAKHVEIRDPYGHKVSGVKEFDTETKKATMYARIGLTKSNGDKFYRVALIGEFSVTDRSKAREVVTFVCTLQGYKAYDKRTNEVIE